LQKQTIKKEDLLLMKIWLINHYAVPPQYYPLARPSLFAKNLIKMGHDVTIIAASTVHNSDKNLIDGKEKIKRETVDGIPYVYIKCSDYAGNGLKRVINILEYAFKLPGVCKTLEKPDAIVATSFDPISCYQGIKIANKYGVTGVAEIADLWPETLVEYSGVSRKNPIVLFLKRIEKNIYLKADSIVYTAAGEYDYIVEQGWQQEIPQEKVTYINNGIDLNLFDYNKNTYTISDEDLNNDSIFKVVYTGSIRRVNNLGGILDVAKEIRNPKVRFLIWGDGDELQMLKQRLKDEHITNVVFKGRVEKKYIPYITSNADLNYAHNSASPLFRYGLSFNKIFDYLAAGKPILCDFPSNYNPVIMGNAGIEVDTAAPKDVAHQIEKFVDMDAKCYEDYCEAARKTASEYDFKLLTQKLVDTINRTRN
jgi:glycosyltransferase involved in cell wall biosynthesis